MSVTAFTLTMKRSIIPGTNKVILSLKMVSTGDASGGSVTAQQQLGAYLPQKYVATILDAGFFNNDNVARAQHIGLTATDWEALPHANLVVSNQTDTLTSGDSTSQFYSRMAMSPYIFPLFIGRNLTADPVVTYICATNTDGKTYTSWIRILVESLS